jgi:hypothetical protein
MGDSANDNWLARRHLVSFAAAAVAAFYLHCLSLIISSNPQAASGRTMSQQWTDLETEAILQYFFTNKSEIGDAGNFKKKTYKAAAEAIPGQARTSSQVQTKWQLVS